MECIVCKSNFIDQEGEILLPNLSFFVDKVLLHNEVFLKRYKLFSVYIQIDRSIKGRYDCKVLLFSCLLI